MSAKQVISDERVRDALHHGVSVLARAVRTTLGPKGRNIALATAWGATTVTHDGVTVARDIELADPFENIGAQLLKQAASTTSDVAGDGTTSSTVLAEALVDEGLTLVSAGASPLLLKRGLDRGVRALVDEIHRQAVPIVGRAQIAQIATVSAEDVEIGELLATLIDALGRDAVITVEEGRGLALEHELVEGMQLDRGYSSPYFLTDTTIMVAELDEPAILITDKKISGVAELLPLLEVVLRSGTKDLLIIAEDVDGEALATLIVNKLRGVIKALVVKAPGFGDRRMAMLEDIAILTGGAVISEETGRTLLSVTPADLGRARRVRADKDTTTIVEGRGDRQAIRARVSQLKQQSDVVTSDYDREKLRERSAALAGGVAVIRVGAPTETAMKERKARLEDALHATRAALEEGIVTGGGVAYMNLAGALDAVPTTFDEDRMALTMLRRALEQPTRQIVANAGLDGGLAVEEIQRRQHESGVRSIGYDVMRGAYGDLVAWGVIDPAKVVRTALENAVSVAGMILSTEVLIAEVPESSARDDEPASETTF
ncbi:MAG: hypothetical protein RLZZ387_621 [Chloroflexota bacterium]|jgi:chaperonin GroEL